ncbi:MAG: hypothetical protein Q4F72_12325, partial [Desulfovibrionaceae bacterium]|nr:hypothetical protein [Desulfovibrionaceae bacterium]
MIMMHIVCHYKQEAGRPFRHAPARQYPPRRPIRLPEILAGWNAHCGGVPHQPGIASWPDSILEVLNETSA